MLIEYDSKDVSEILNEKNDYKYQDATKKINNLDEKKINNAIQSTHKIENIINKYGYEVENAKRYLVSIKKLLEF
jgi:N-acetyl-anhydromuramyl-L-alanine amidase AmpD